MITVYDKIVHKKLNGVDIVNIGITGSIACGKSTVSNYLRDKGYTIIDADKIGHTALTDNEVREKLEKSFGLRIIENNEISREKLGKLAFGNEENLKKLNPSGYYMLLSMVGIIVMIIWMVSLVSQIRLRKAIAKQGKKAEEVLPYTSKTGVVGSYIALLSFATIILLQLVSDYATGGFVKMSYNLVCPAIGVLMYLTFKVVTKRKFVKLEEMDIHPYKEK